MAGHSRGALFFFNVICPIWRSHGTKIVNLASILTFKVIRLVAVIESPQICLVFPWLNFLNVLNCIESLSGNVFDVALYVITLTLRQWKTGVQLQWDDMTKSWKSDMRKLVYFMETVSTIDNSFNSPEMKSNSQLFLQEGIPFVERVEVTEPSVEMNHQMT